MWTPLFLLQGDLVNLDPGISLNNLFYVVFLAAYFPKICKIYRGKERFITLDEFIFESVNSCVINEQVWPSGIFKVRSCVTLVFCQLLYSYRHSVVTQMELFNILFDGSFNSSILNFKANSAGANKSWSRQITILVEDFLFVIPVLPLFLILQRRQ